MKGKPSWIPFLFLSLLTCLLMPAPASSVPVPSPASAGAVLTPEPAAHQPLALMAAARQPLTILPAAFEPLSSTPAAPGLLAAMAAMASPLTSLPAAPKPPRFHVLALYENGGHHIAYSRRAKVWLDQLAADSNFAVDYITNTDSINEEFLTKYQLFLQLDYAPYAWKQPAVDAFQKYIDEGRGGWIGFHHGTLLGEFDGYPIWPWFSDFMGGIRYKNYIARFARATVRVEKSSHPVMQGLPESFVIAKEEWYTYDKSPRPNVNVLAHVDESTYYPDTTIKMGDHPVIWSNEHKKARNVYIFMGHDPILYDDPNYRKLVSNAIFWAAATRPSHTKKSKK